MTVQNNLKKKRKSSELNINYSVNFVKRVCKCVVFDATIKLVNYILCSCSSLYSSVVVWKYQNSRKNHLARSFEVSKLSKPDQESFGSKQTAFEVYGTDMTRIEQRQLQTSISQQWKIDFLWSFVNNEYKTQKSLLRTLKFGVSLARFNFYGALVWFSTPTELNG